MSTILDLLTEAARGLTYMSESDFAVHAFFWDKDHVGADALTPERIKALENIAPDAPVETVAWDAFFEPLVQDEDWYEEEEREIVRRYQTLQQLLTDHLTARAVYKIGEVTKSIYVVGKTAEGAFAGVQTKAVET